MKFLKNLTAYIKRYIYRRNSLLYIEITHDALTLALLTHKKNMFEVINTTIIKFENSEYEHESIFNPTAIYLHIKKYIQEHRLYKPKTLACLPEYKNIQPEKRYMAILQAALCLAKAPIYIEAICENQFLTPAQQITFKDYLLLKKTDLLAPFKRYNQHSPITWLTRTGLFAFILITILGYIQISDQSTHELMQKELNILSTQTEKLKEKVQALHDIQGEITYFQNKIEFITDLTRTHRNPVKILLALSRSVPDHTFITHLTIGPVETNQKTSEKTSVIKSKDLPNVKTEAKNQGVEQKSSVITIEGLSNDTGEITQLLSNLDKQSNIEDLSLVKIRKLKKTLSPLDTTTDSQYYFRIAGFLE